MTNQEDLTPEEIAKRSQSLEKEELEKKYEVQKTEILKKRKEAETALTVKVVEAEMDYAETIINKPDFLSDEQKKGYLKYLDDLKVKINEELENLKVHEKALALDYNELKTEPKVNMLIDYSKPVNHAVKINGALMQMLFDYFNFLNNKKEHQVAANIHIDCFLNEAGLFAENFPHSPSMELFTGSVMINFKDLTRIVVTLKKYFEKGEGFVHKICFVSESRTDLNPDYLSKKILFNAISHSKIKGSYITMKPGSLTWTEDKLEKRNFSDIFLPKSMMEDLKLYTALSDKTGRLLRYLMVGNPGTCKTESTLVLANYLMSKGVTIIKTGVCDALQEKIELAELLAPSLLILDDLDLTVGSRKKGGVTPGLGLLLDVLDGTKKLRRDVGVLATTNAIDLIDMAVQRPGRFDKILSFDSLTKGNVKNIVLKSMNKNFGLTEENEIVRAFIHEDVILKFHSCGATGSHIYHTTEMLMLRIQTLDLENINSDWVIDEITEEINMLARIRKTDFLQDKMSPSTNSGIGFSNTNKEEEDEDDKPEIKVKEHVAEPVMSFIPEPLEKFSGVNVDSTEPVADSGNGQTESSF